MSLKINLQQLQDGLQKISGGGIITIDSGSTIRITDAPSNGLDLVNKDYVDSVASGLDPKESVRFATTANITSILSANQATVEAALDIPLTSPATSLNIGDRILVKDQTDPKENGIYVWGGSPASLTRSTDMDGTPANEVSAGNHTIVELGDILKGTGWSVVGDGVLTLGVDDINWVKVNFIQPDGNGIYDGNGTIPASTISTLTDNWTLNGGDVQIIGKASVGDVISPDYTFHVSGSTRMQSKLGFGSGGGVASEIGKITYGSNELHITSNGANNLQNNVSTGYFSWFAGAIELVRLTNGGNLGIGTNNPTTKLDVAGDIRTSTDISTPKIVIGGNTTNDIMARIGNGIVGDGSGAATGLFIDASAAAGNLDYRGIYTQGYGTGPNNNYGLQGQARNGAITSIGVYGAAVNGTSITPAGRTVGVEGANLSNLGLFHYGGRFTNSADVTGAILYGVYGSSGSAGTNQTRYGVYGTGNGTGTGTNIGGYFEAINGVNNYALITGNGNVGIGLNTPTEKLHINGNARVDGKLSINTIVDGVNQVIIKGDSNTGGTNALKLINSNNTDIVTFRNDSQSIFNGQVAIGAGGGLISGSSLTAFRNSTSASEFIAHFSSTGGNAFVVKANRVISVRDSAGIQDFNINSRIWLDDKTEPSTPTSAGILYSLGGKAYWKSSDGTNYDLTATGVSSNIYTSNGILTGNRIIETGVNTLNISTSPAYIGSGTLSINNSVGSLVLDVSVSGSNLTNNIRLGDGNKYYISAGSSGLFFSDNNGVERLRITQTGDVSIGVGIPSEKLHINGNTRVDGRLLVTHDNYLFNGTTITSRISNNLGNMLEFTDGGGVNFNNYVNNLGVDLGTQNFNSYFLDYNFSSMKTSPNPTGTSYLYFDRNLTNSAPFTRMGINGVNTSTHDLLHLTLDKNGTDIVANPTMMKFIDSYGVHTIDMAGGTYIKTGLDISLTNTFTTSTTGTGINRAAYFNATGGDLNQAIATGNGQILLGDLAGTGTRMVVADSSGILSTQAIPSGGSSTLDGLTDVTLGSPLSDGDVLTYNSGGFWENTTPKDSTAPGRTVVNSATYTILSTDDLVAVTYTSTGTVTLTLPDSATIGVKRYIIADEGGNAGTNNITINPSGTDTIIGQSSFIMNGNYDSIQIYSNGTGGWFIY